jgi:hypothetical protein
MNSQALEANVKLLTLMVTLLIATTVAAFAQETATVRVGDLIAPWLENVVGAAAILITAVIGYVANLIRQKTGIDIETAHREALQQALTNAIGLVINKFGTEIGDKVINVGSPVLRDAISYVNRAVPDAVKHFGLTPEQLAEKLAAKLGLAAVTATEANPV